MRAAICPAVLDFLSANRLFQLERREVASPAFSKLRGGVRELVAALRDSEDDWIREQSVRMQRLLAVWLTSPSDFRAGASDELLSVLGEVESLTRTWGALVSDSLEMALAGAEGMSTGESGLQAETRAAIHSLEEAQTDFRIYCHRTVRQSFYALLEPDLAKELLSEDRFLHSFRDYRDSAPFELLLKVGPLRREGWGASPSSLMSAPRYGRLLQIVWAGTADDRRFGADPVLGDARESLWPVTGTTVELAGGIRWTARVQPVGQEQVADAPVDDLDLVPFRELASQEARRQALLLVLEGNRGVMYPPNATVLAFDPSAAGDSAFVEAQLNEDVRPGMFLVWPRVQEEDHDGGLYTAFGGSHYTTWKALLKDELSRDASGFVARLRATGISLTHLEAAARHWSREPTSVIHAPQMRSHFHLLMRVLGVEDRRLVAAAWQEIARSRGEAIQAGVQEHSRLIELSIRLLRSMAEEVSISSKTGDEFNVLTPVGSPLFGAFFFMRIQRIEDGYRAPEADLRQVTTVEEAAKWLV